MHEYCWDHQYYWDRESVTRITHARAPRGPRVCNSHHHARVLLGPRVCDSQDHEKTGILHMR